MKQETSLKLECSTSGFGRSCDKGNTEQAGNMVYTVTFGFGSLCCNSTSAAGGGAAAAAGDASGGGSQRKGRGSGGWRGGRRACCYRGQIDSLKRGKH